MESSPGQTVVGVPLLETKLYIPRLRPGLVSRPRLIERLEQGAGRKLTLVSAAAGFGKTTLLAEWLAGAGDRPAAWVSLDPGDNDPALFWSYVATVLGRMRPGCGTRTLSALQAQQPPSTELVVTTLINEITAIEEDFALVLDDFHVVDAQPVHDGVAYLLDHLPPRMHLVIASRSDPALPLARLRARGESIELRADDLRFTHDEAAAFLHQVTGLDLSAADADALERRTEGWVAGLQLAAVSMQGRDDVSGFIQAFAGDDRYIMDYLVEEVLQGQAEGVRRFLLETSILDRLSGPLCDAVTGRTNSRELLETLERGNLFVVSLDDKRRWYRYHHLFADVLRAHAKDEQPGLVPLIHRRAVAWFEEHGMAAEAIEQARAAGDHATVARLLVANYDAFERLGRHASILRWSGTLPDDLVRARPRLAIMLASSSITYDNNNRAARRLTAWADEAVTRIEERGGLDPSDNADETVVGSEGLDALKGELLALQLMHAWRNLPAEDMLVIADRALGLLPPATYRVRIPLLMMEAGLQMELSTLESGLTQLERGVEEARRARNPTLLAGILAHCGRVYAAMGRLEDARRSFEEALLAGKDVSSEARLEMCGPHTGLAEVLLERGDLAGAVAHAEKALDFASEAPTRSPVLHARTTAAKVMVAAGDTATGLAWLAAADEFVRGSSHSRYASSLAAAKVTIACWIGDWQAAASVVRERGLSPDMTVDSGNEGEATAYARYLIARGDGDGARRVLSRVLPIVRERGRVQHEIRALVLQAQAHELSGDREHALESLGRATMLGERGRYTRTFTAEGPITTGLLVALAEAARRGSGPEMAGSPAYLDYLLAEASAMPEPATARHAAAGLAEPLTDREIEILRHIAAGMRNREIADLLYISPATVKRHIANAYGKLGVRHRTEAVARARELDLL